MTWGRLLGWKSRLHYLYRNCYWFSLNFVRAGRNWLNFHLFLWSRTIILNSYWNKLSFYWRLLPFLYFDWRLLLLLNVDERLLLFLHFYCDRKRWFSHILHAFYLILRNYLLHRQRMKRKRRRRHLNCILAVYNKRLRVNVMTPMSRAE